MFGLFVSACDAPTGPPPAPREPTGQTIGYTCQMTLADHEGPKAQIFPAGAAEPLWFSSARDALIHVRLEGASRPHGAFYVNDMGRASWSRPEPGTWITAETATYVVGSRRGGGMGGPEVVPFADRRAAESFTATYGGRVVSLDGIAEADLFPTAAPEPSGPDRMGGPGNGR